MSRIDYGNALTTLVEQPGAVFSKTKSGYHSGTRTFKCDITVAESLAPLRGTADTQHAAMFVDDYTITEGTNGIATIVVTYSGKLGEDNGGTETDPDSALVYDCAATIDAIYVVSDGLYFSKYNPRVSHTYVTATFPAFDVGAYRNPPAFADKIPSQTVNVPNSGEWYLGYSQSGWRLENRQTRSVGSNYEITDTYVFDYKVNSALSPTGVTNTFDPT